MCGVLASRSRGRVGAVRRAHARPSRSRAPRCLPATDRPPPSLVSSLPVTAMRWRTLGWRPVRTCSPAPCPPSRWVAAAAQRSSWWWRWWCCRCRCPGGAGGAAVVSLALALLCCHCCCCCCCCCCAVLSLLLLLLLLLPMLLLLLPALNPYFTHAKPHPASQHLSPKPPPLWRMLRP